ncbi:MAG: phosphodiester glycosidase family protein [Gemmatimonadaceae bacterium]|nr:phosphodiester glycosidase family protein [Gemmatimonadaceae bacterium]
MAPATAVEAISCNPAAEPAYGLAPRLEWRGDEVQWSTWPVRLGERGIPVRLVVVTFDPRRLRLSLDLVQKDGVLQPWHLGVAPADARVALNAGQFGDDGPWGWVVHRGREWQAPGSGTLAGALVTDTAGAVDIIAPGDIAQWRGTPALREALQSYPLLLTGDGAPPAALCPATAQVDLTHRDTRLAIGIRRDGRVVIALSRYAGGTLPDRTPIGPTTPEMAEAMRRLGAVRALMLDGGLSAQLLVRERAGAAPRRWQGLRNVPLALVAGK